MQRISFARVVASVKRHSICLVLVAACGSASSPQKDVSRYDEGSAVAPSPVAPSAVAPSPSVAPSPVAPVPVITDRPTTPLEVIRAHAKFCATAPPGCTRTCVPSPAWASATPTFTHAELWAYEDRCPDAPQRLTQCTLALERAGVWYAAFDTVCKTDAGPAATTDFSITRIQSRGGIDAFEMTTKGTLEEAHEGPHGERVDSTLDTSARIVNVCGVGPSKKPSCMDAIYVGGRILGDAYAGRSWDLGDGVVNLGAFPADSTPDLMDDDGSAAVVHVNLR